jgi:predicted TIM-barrel fold metal-dependent hydrolase
MAAQIGLDRQVLVQASPYGADNSCMLDGLIEAGARSRGVAVIDETTTDEMLTKLHAHGVRGVRVNAATFGDKDPSKIVKQLSWTAARVAPLGWHVQIFADLAVIDALAADLQKLPTDLVIDHMGLPKAERGVAQPGFSTIFDLLANGRTWVKVSGTYRISSQPDYADAVPIARALIAAAPDRVVWGTDWPHTGEHKGATHEAPLTDYRPLDAGHLTNLLIESCADDAQLKRVLVDNPTKLYDFD